MLKNQIRKLNLIKLDTNIELDKFQPSALSVKREHLDGLILYSPINNKKAFTFKTHFDEIILCKLALHEDGNVRVTEYLLNENLISIFNNISYDEMNWYIKFCKIVRSYLVDMGKSYIEHGTFDLINVLVPHFHLDKNEYVSENIEYFGVLETYSSFETDQSSGFWKMDNKLIYKWVKNKNEFKVMNYLDIIQSTRIADDGYMISSNIDQTQFTIVKDGKVFYLIKYDDIYKLYYQKGAKYYLIEDTIDLSEMIKPIVLYEEKAK